MSQQRYHVRQGDIFAQEGRFRDFFGGSSAAQCGISFHSLLLRLWLQRVKLLGPSTWGLGVIRICPQQNFLGYNSRDLIDAHQTCLSWPSSQVRYASLPSASQWGHVASGMEAELPMPPLSLAS